MIQVWRIILSGGGGGCGGGKKLIPERAKFLKLATIDDAPGFQLLASISHKAV